MGKPLLALAISGWLAGVFGVLKRLGPIGLFLLGIADSSFLFLPFGNDLLLIALVSANRDSWIWLLYVVAAAAGSVVGALIVDLLMRKVGEEGLEHFVNERTVSRLRKKLEKHAGRAIFVATLMPPPFPFTAVVMSASALQAPRKTILASVFFGRLVRFTIEALLALWVGQRLLSWLDSDYLDYAVYGFLAIAAVGTTLTVRKWVTGRKQWRSGAKRSDDRGDEDEGSPDLEAA
jgi:membrane protein YqaA with SNARE-associated domain